MLGKADTNIPLVACFSGSHYEGLVPDTELDVLKTMELVKSDQSIEMQEIPVLNDLMKQVQLSVIEKALMKPQQP